MKNNLEGLKTGDIIANKHGDKATIILVKKVGFLRTEWNTNENFEFDIFQDNHDYTIISRSKITETTEDSMSSITINYTTVPQLVG